MSSPRLSIIPAGAVTDRSLEPRDLQVLCLLGRHTDKGGWCARSQVKMAQELDCSRGSVQNSLARLSTAGWIEAKRRDFEVEQAGKQPSRSYAYRVLLDRDDYSFEAAVTRDGDDAENPAESPAESHAENANEGGGCQPVGTPVPTQEWHQGANAYVGTRANPYIGTNNDPLERSHLERERDARARDRKARFLVDFEARWPTSAADDRQRTAYAAEALGEAEAEAALKGIAPFLENLKRLKRDRCPAGWRYLEEKRWTLLDTPQKSATPIVQKFAAGSPEAAAISTLYIIAGKQSVLAANWMRASDGALYYRRTVTPQLLTLSSAPPRSEWPALDRRQAASWNDLLATFVTVVWSRLTEGARAPWPWPPSKDGKIYSTGPPDTLMSAQDQADLEKLKAV